MAVLIRSRSALRALLLTAMIPGLTGCFGVRIRRVQRTVIVDHVLDATLDQLLTAMAARYKAIDTLTATVAVTATSGGTHTGEVKEIPTFSGYILLRKPKDLQVILKLPVVGSMALDMVSDGTNFKLFIPPKHRAIVGSDEVTKPGSTGLDNLRPGIVRDSLLVPGIEPDEFVTLTAGSRTFKPEDKKNETIEEPDYDLTVLRKKQGNELERIRVIHISRVDLLPYQQDTYDREGRVVTTVTYDKYQKFGGIDYPMSIFIQRPVDEFTLQININKLVPNEKLDDEQFTLKIPDGTPTQTM